MELIDAMEDVMELFLYVERHNMFRLPECWSVRQLAGPSVLYNLVLYNLIQLTDPK